MANPKQKHTKSRKNIRRAQLFLASPTLTKCPKCGKLTKSHTVCPYCGYYRGKEIIDVFGKLTKKERKKREKEMKTGKKEEDKEKPLSWEEMSKK